MTYTNHATAKRPEPFPPLPSLWPTVLSLAQALGKAPGFFKILEEFSEFVCCSEATGLVGLVASRHVLSGIPACMGFGAALVAPLPDVLEPGPARRTEKWNSGCYIW